LASIIKIKRSGTQGSPGSLKSGELAYSWASGVNKLYFGKGDDGSGNATEIIQIGGQYFTDLLDHTPGVLTTGSAIIVDSNNKIDLLNVDNLRLDANTISSTDTNGDIYLVPAGLGKVNFYNAYTFPTALGPIGQALVSDGAGGITWAGVNTSNTSTNIAGGTAGQVPYQTAPGATSFYGPGTAGQLLVSAGANAPVYTNTTSIQVGFADTAGRILAANTTTQQVGFADTAGRILAANTTTQQVGFAVDLLGGTAGQLVYQIGANDTGFVGPGTAGQLLVSAGANAPVYTNTASIYVNSAVNAQTLYGGTAGQLVYQSAAGATAFAGPGTAGQILISAGTSAPTYTNTTSVQVGFADTAGRILAANTTTQQVGFADTAGRILAANTTTQQVGFADTAGRLLAANTTTQQVGFAANLLAGATGSVPYQSSGNTTAMLPLSGTSGALLTAGSTAPAYITQVTARNGTGDLSTASGQSLVVSSGGIGVIGDSHFADDVNIRGDLVVKGGTTFDGDVTFNGTATFVYSTNTVFTDNILNLHSPPGGVLNTWTSNDGKDIGFVFHNYVDNTDNDAFLGWANDTGFLEWYAKGTENVTSGTYVGTAYGIFKAAGARFVGTDSTHGATSGAVQVTGGVGIGGNLFVGGVATATTFIGDLVGTSSFANDLTGGAAGSIPYQNATNSTIYLPIGAIGKVLTVSTSGNAISWSDIDGGTY
jgi:hypothetical protein